MQRGEIGKCESTGAGGEQVRAFVPLPLPPAPPLALDGHLQQTLETATRTLDRHHWQDILIRQFDTAAM